MNAMQGIMQGFEVAFSLEGIFFVLIGVTAGTLIGMLPGLGPITAIAIMIPMIYGMDPTIAMVLMAGVYYGAVFGGSTASILLNAPGISGTVATAFDGYPMAQQGKAGQALAIAAISSFTGGTVSIVLLMLFAPTLASVAVSFGPVEYFALMFMGLVAISSLSEGSVIKALISGVLGLMAVTIGIDAQTGTPRFTFGNPNLLEGIDFLIVALGLFALAEVAFLIKKRHDDSLAKTQNIGSLKLTKQDFKEMKGPLLRHSPFGFIMGVLPGAGATISSFISYVIEKRFTKKPEEFGKGSVKGLAAPEASNNAATSGSFVPLLSLGIPGSGTTAVMLGALLVLGINPGPLLFQDHPVVFWGIVASMYIGNLFLLVLNLPLIPYIAKILKIPRPLLISLVMMFCIIGVYSISFNIFDLYLLLIFGVIGYLFRIYSFPAPPFILAFVLGGMMEQSLRQALTISNGDYMIFLESPIAIGLFVVSILSFAYPFLRDRKRKR
ncbi:putative tricarboxylic transport membrane protein [Lentibacillus halodurans]|uniref:Putative tricarboxylic transport membrane protein n=1 Tax=Lentibacillus halodurans TaxID=237679 RepID=A0A1I0Z7N3_9BACI|nr:tripartite tricarboxylate transporter permease [Lentibacillus halodurans]SFB21645.1 putative tricarboxylic transport membrane protein [Lentibacillus halodurans]